MSQRTCSVPECNREHYAKGLCAAHYQRQRVGSAAVGPIRDLRDGCSIPGCDRIHEANGLCDTHYKRQRKGADLLAPIRTPATTGAPIEDRLTYVVVDGCWEYDGADDGNGYGVLRLNGKTEKAHRVAYRFWVGPIPEGLGVLHHCDNPPCINPAHLFVGTDADNVADMIAKGRMARGVQLPQSKLTESKVRAIRADNRTHTVIAAEHGIGRRTVGFVKDRRNWGWLE